MPRETTRRAVLGALVAAGIGGVGLSPAGGFLDTFAPLSGRAWQGSRRSVPDTVSSHHGDATVTYDDYHVPHVEAGDEAAAYFAVGYAQAADRLFEMDLIRRLMDGRLSAVLGERTVEADVFNTKMDFRGAAEASAEALAGSRAEALSQSYADGVNAFIESGPTPLEFDL
ncbi:MAG TPA: penicillin acylase family protein, partial [Halobacteriales archaeon]|nr:penicillin acylase family protein [Halobacteriales archaeon]